MPSKNQNSCKEFAYRNIKKEFTTFKPVEMITKNYHLELGEHNDTVVVEDRPDDWFEIAQIDADKVGLVNVLEIARRTGDNVFDGRYSFKDNEALDISELDPNNPNKTIAQLQAGQEAQKKLAATAEQLGVSVDDLVDAFVKGTLSTLIASKLPSEEKKEGE